MRSGPLFREINCDPAQLLALHAADVQRYPAFLESAAVGGSLGQFDILFAYPQERLTLDSSGALHGPWSATAGGNFLRALDTWRAAEPSADPRAPAPFVGGWFLYLSYELAGEIEPVLRLPRTDQGPIAQAIRIPAAIIHEHATSRSWLVGPDSNTIAALEADLHAVKPLAQQEGSLMTGALIEEESTRYLRAVERALEYIAAGDIYQANLSRGWRAELRGQTSAAQLFARLRKSNPGPFSGLAQVDGVSVISSSPERLVHVQGRDVSTRPIAGTRPRGNDAAADRTLADELRGHPKERAEHIMLIDLERNDLGRVCEPGSVRVDEFMTIESYAHVHHIVSNVRGVLRHGATPGQVLAAVFPGGTITGCPKVRCMEIIAELEAEARGPYTGSIGYLGVNGAMDLNILIRTMSVRGRELTFRAGAGVVADSSPERELEETRAKARGLVRALTETA